MARRIVTAREQHEMLSPWRQGAVNQDLVDRLKGEFHGWRKQQPRGSIFGGGIIGGLDEWTNIEKFLKDQYPAAHRGLGMGYEMAGPLLDGRPMQSDYMMSGPLEYSTPQPYETGPEAEAQHGYDPKEIAAGMLLLHNKSDRFRGDMSEEDQGRLNDIAQKRFQMQRQHEQRQTTAATDPTRLMGININDTHQDYTGQILRGEKTIETRDTLSLNPYVGRRIALFRTHDSKRVPTLVVGHATVGEPVHYPDAESFDADYDRHRVGPDSPHHFTRAKYGEKYGYPMLDPVALDRPMLVNSKGNVARGAEDTDFAPYDGPWPLHTAMLSPPWRLAAFNQGLVDGLRNEFSDWVSGKVRTNELGDVSSLPPEHHYDIAVSNWPHVENFLKERYPAAHRNLGFGAEGAKPLLDEPELWEHPYATGPDAVTAHGYDPKEIAAGMLLLHQNYADRSDFHEEDQQRLTDIAQKRFQMQRDYEKRQELSQRPFDPRDWTGLD